nr:DUF2125 domain-containing protein [Sagittula salina]
MLWGGWWTFQAWTLRSAVEDWFEARRLDGWVAEYDDLSVRGFPSRLDVTLTTPRLMDPDHGTGWAAPFLQILGLTYDRGHVILAFADSQRLTLPSGEVQIASEGLRASLVRDGEMIERLNAEADVLNLTAPGGRVALAGVLANFHHQDGARYQLTLAVRDIATPQGALDSGRSEGLDLQAALTFDTPWTLDALRGPRPQPREIDLAGLAYRQNGLDLNVAGTLTADAQGRADGGLSVRAVNWRALLEQARAAGTLPEALADTLENALTLAAGLSGRQDTLDLPLDFHRGEVSFGIIPLGQAPRLSLP